MKKVQNKVALVIGTKLIVNGGYINCGKVATR